MIFRYIQEYNAILEENKKKSKLEQFLIESENSLPLCSALNEFFNKLIKEIDTPLEIAIVGQFSSGKSSFLNAILKEELLPTGITPITSKVCKILYGKERVLEICYKDNTRVLRDVEYLQKLNREATKQISHFCLYLNNPLLKEITFMDTPGFNSQNQEDTEVTTNILQKVDGIIWLTLIDNAGKKSEKELLEKYMQNYAHKSLCVLNQKDRLEEKEVLLSLEYAKKAFNGIFATILPVSAKNALKGFKESNKELLEESNFLKVHDFLKEVISPQAKVAKEYRILRNLRFKLLSMECEIHTKNKKTLQLKRRILEFLEENKNELKVFYLHQQKEFNAFYGELDSLLEEISQKIFSKLVRQKIEISQDKWGGLLKQKQEKEVWILQKETLSIEFFGENSSYLKRIRSLSAKMRQFVENFTLLEDRAIKFYAMLSGFASTEEICKMQQKELEGLCSFKKELNGIAILLQLSYKQAITGSIEKLDLKIKEAIKKHKSNPLEFPTFTPTLENIRDYLNEGINYEQISPMLFGPMNLLKKAHLKYFEIFGQNIDLISEKIFANIQKSKEERDTISKIFKRAKNKSGTLIA
ncbi:dynamin family protein [Helicobacter burdigaliensis]|uniref:dynamin family protein n=1 Tax=Helicobacter burdigaliensis TaxID=2315334 RepID=UPI000EF7379E|nr:dynamin family protein [Helicobacter burdigaliensis]